MSGAADRARSFDLAAEEYERTRPGYPAAVLEKLPVPADATVLDLGAGTGKLTRVLVGRYSHVIAVEPLDGMRAILEKVVPQAKPLKGRAEQIPLADASVDAVFAGQAFHWFATDEAVREIARVLRRDGVFCLIWNSPDESRPWSVPQTYTDYLEGAAHGAVPGRRAAVRRGYRPWPVRRTQRVRRPARSRSRPARLARQRALRKLDR